MRPGTTRQPPLLPKLQENGRRKMETEHTGMREGTYLTWGMKTVIQKPLLLRTKVSSLMEQKNKIHNAASHQTEGYTNSRRNDCTSVL